MFNRYYFLTHDSYPFPFVFSYTDAIEFEFNGNHYKFSPVNDEYVLINYTTNNKLHFNSIEELMELESSGMNLQKNWKKLKIKSIQ